MKCLLNGKSFAGLLSWLFNSNTLVFYWNVVTFQGMCLLYCLVKLEIKSTVRSCSDCQWLINLASCKTGSTPVSLINTLHLVYSEVMCPTISWPRPVARQPAEYGKVTGIDLVAKNENVNDKNKNIAHMETV